MTADPLLQEHRTAEDGDLDLLVTCPDGISLLDLIGLRQDVEDLTDVHATIAYILRHRDAIDAYMAEVEAKAEEDLRMMDERSPQEGLREELERRMVMERP